MNLLKNMIFHTNEITSLTELDPPEHKDYLVDCLKICQQALQSETGSENMGTITGLANNVKHLGRCFQCKVFGEEVQIPFDFIKTLGIFELQIEHGNAQLTVF